MDFLSRLINFEKRLNRIDYFFIMKFLWQGSEWAVRSVDSGLLVAVIILGLYFSYIVIFARLVDIFELTDDEIPDSKKIHSFSFLCLILLLVPYLEYLVALILTFRRGISWKNNYKSESVVPALLFFIAFWFTFQNVSAHKEVSYNKKNNESIRKEQWNMEEDFSNVNYYYFLFDKTLEKELGGSSTLSNQVERCLAESFYLKIYKICKESEKKCFKNNFEYLRESDGVIIGEYCVQKILSEFPSYIKSYSLALLDGKYVCQKRPLSLDSLKEWYSSKKIELVDHSHSYCNSFLEGYDGQNYFYFFKDKYDCECFVKHLDDKN